MTRIASCALALALSAAFVTAQGPPGIPGFNDYTLSGAGSNAPSCTALFIGPGAHVFATSTQPGASIFLFASLGACTPGPIFGCQGSQVFLPFPPLPISFASGVADAAGDFSVPLFLPPGLNFSTQAVIFDPACGGLVLFSQAFDAST